MFKKFILNLDFVKAEVASSSKTVADLMAKTNAHEENIKELKFRNQELIRQKNESDTQIRNFKASALELQQEGEEDAATIVSLKIKIVELEKIINTPKEDVPSTDIERQLKNCKKEISELKVEIEIQKQITFEKNQILNKFQDR